MTEGVGRMGQKGEVRGFRADIEEGQERPAAELCPVGLSWDRLAAG